MNDSDSGHLKVVAMIPNMYGMPCLAYHKKQDKYFISTFMLSALWMPGENFVDTLDEDDILNAGMDVMLIPISKIREWFNDPEASTDDRGLESEEVKEAVIAFLDSQEMYMKALMDTQSPFNPNQMN